MIELGQDNEKQSKQLIYPNTDDQRCFSYGGMKDVYITKIRQTLAPGYQITSRTVLEPTVKVFQHSK